MHTFTSINNIIEAIDELFNKLYSPVLQSFGKHIKATNTPAIATTRDTVITPASKPVLSAVTVTVIVLSVNK